MALMVLWRFRRSSFSLRGKNHLVDRTTPGKIKGDTRKNISMCILRRKKWKLGIFMFYSGKQIIIKRKQ